MRTWIKIVATLVGIFILASLYNYAVLGQKDFGMLNVHKYCQNGIYDSHSYGLLVPGETEVRPNDPWAVYYDENGKYLAECSSLEANPHPECIEIEKLAGTCTRKGVPLYLFAAPIVKTVSRILPPNTDCRTVPEKVPPGYTGTVSIICP